MSETAKINCNYCGGHVEYPSADYEGKTIPCPFCAKNLVLRSPSTFPTQLTISPVAVATPVSVAYQTQRAEAEEIPALWNPRAAIILSLVLFNPAFGAYLHAKNANALNRTGEATVNWICFFVSLLALAATVAISFVFPQIPEQTLRYAWLCLCGVWSIAGWRQVKYVKEHLQNNYQRRSWTAPISIATLCLAMFVAALIFAPAPALSTQELEAQVKIEIQESLKKNEATKTTQVQSLKLTHENGAKYKGILVAQTEGNTETATVDVTYDRKGFGWKIVPETQPWIRQNNDDARASNGDLAIKTIKQNPNIQLVAELSNVGTANENLPAQIVSSPTDFIGRICNLVGRVRKVIRSDKADELPNLVCLICKNGDNSDTEVMFFCPKKYDTLKEGDYVGVCGYFVGVGIGLNTPQIELVGNKVELFEDNTQSQ